MKKIIIIIAAIAVFSVTSYSQDVVRNGKTFEQVKKSSVKTEDKTGFTYKDSKGNTYDIFIGKSGACYIKKISKKTGNEYKQYIGEEISRQVCQSLGREYTSKSRK